MPPKQKNRTYHRYHITISPQATTEEQLTKIAKTLTKKDVAKHCYVLETGKNNTHLHMHILIEYTKDRRIDTLKTSINTILKKEFTLTSNLVRITPAYNPIYLIQQYLTKQMDLINNGFEIEELKKELKSHNRNVFKIDAQQLVITRASLLRIYREVQPRLKTKFQNFPDAANTHLHELLKVLEQDDYNISFLIWNKKQSLDVIKFANNIEIEFISSF